MNMKACNSRPFSNLSPTEVQTRSIKLKNSRNEIINKIINLFRVKLNTEQPYRFPKYRSEKWLPVAMQRRRFISM